MAKPAAEVAPDVYKVVFENERLRLLEVRMVPGAASELHSHPNYLVYALSDGKIRLANAVGEGGEVEISQGDTMWREAEEHSAVNIGSAEVRALFIELK
jgi:quercetin dioxygenase-like cupin family protein